MLAPTRDELHLLVHPIAVCKTMRLFDEGESPIPLKLISSETFETGVLNLVYGPAESTGDGTYEDAKMQLGQPERSPAFLYLAAHVLLDSEEPPLVRDSLQALDSAVDELDS